MTSSRRVASAAPLCALALILIGAGSGAASGHHSHFHGSGTWTASAPSACGQDMCYSASGNLTVNNSVPVTFTGEGMFDPNTCKTTRTRTCCINTMLGQFQTPDGNINFSFEGKGCSLSATLETLKGPMKLSGTSGNLTGFTGAGHISAQLNPQNGDGPITVTGAIHP